HLTIRWFCFDIRCFCLDPVFVVFKFLAQAKYYIDKYMPRAGFDNDNFDIAMLDNSNPSFNDYLARIELLEEKTASINSRIAEIRQLKEEMRNAVYLVKDYEHKEKIIEKSGILAPPQMKQMILNQKVVLMNETQRYHGDNDLFS
ncbi:hypothetical protein ROZALSC1DRAFT_24910, partial [Rozella allomycis CSF55]